MHGNIPYVFDCWGPIQLSTFYYRTPWLAIFNVHRAVWPDGYTIFQKIAHLQQCKFAKKHKYFCKRVYTFAKFY